MQPASSNSHQSKFYLAAEKNRISQTAVGKPEELNSINVVPTNSIAAASGEDYGTPLAQNLGSKISKLDHLTSDEVAIEESIISRTEIKQSIGIDDHETEEFDGLLKHQSVKLPEIQGINKSGTMANSSSVQQVESVLSGMGAQSNSKFLASSV